MTYQLIYSSESTVPMPFDELEELLEHARKSNGDHGVTGALIYADRMFLQILEGEEAHVNELMEKIRKDVRHENVTVLQERKTTYRFFGEWNMAYVGATREQVANWAGLGTVVGAANSSCQNESELRRTSEFAREILSLLNPGEHPVSSQS